jgi:membrane-bound metal-dependent hydrolase YbcI (DUF457 family)
MQAITVSCFRIQYPYRHLTEKRFGRILIHWFFDMTTLLKFQIFWNNKGNSFRVLTLKRRIENVENYNFANCSAKASINFPL